MADKNVNTKHPSRELSYLSDTELLAMLLQRHSDNTTQLQVAERILTHYGNLRTFISVPVSVLRQDMLLTENQAEMVATVLEIVRRLNQYGVEERLIIRDATDAVRLLCDMRSLKQEQVRLILLDINNQVIATPTLYIGSLHGAVIRAAEVFREAMLQNCPALILAHNHPCGDPSPSPEDVELTRSLIAAGKLLDIRLLDHLIIGEQGWRSLKQQGLAF